MKNFLFFIIIICTLSCTFNDNGYERLGFGKEQKLKFNLLDLNDYIYKPTWIEIFDSLLLVFDPVEGLNYTIYNINTLKPVISGGKKGEGPNDILYGQFVDKINDKEFQVSDLVGKKILLFNIDSILKDRTFLPQKRISFKQQTDNPIGIMYYLNDSTNIALGPFQTGKYALLSGDSTAYWGEHPAELDSKLNPFFIHQGVMQINSSRDCILYHSPLGYYYEILNYRNGSLSKVSGEYELTEFKFDCSTENTIKGMNAADFTDNEIFMMFSGRTNKEYPSDAFLADNIFVCKLNGEKVKHYKTDRSNVCIAVDGKCRRIYCVCQNPESYEFEIGYYQY